MNLIGPHIENAIAAGRIKNSAEIARKLDVARATVSRWQAGDRTPSAEEARALADVIGAPEEMLMAECEAQRAKDEATRAVWLRVARTFKGSQKGFTTVALALLAVVVYFVTGETETIGASMLWLGSITSNTNYGDFAALALLVLFASQAQPLTRSLRRWGVFRPT